MTADQIARVLAEARQGRRALLGGLPATLRLALDGWAHRLARQRLARRHALVMATRAR